MRTCRAITGHQGPLSPQDENYKGSKYNVMVEWETGEINEEPLSLIAADDPVTCDTFLPVVSLFLLRSNNSMTQTSQYQTQQSSRKHSGAPTILLPLLQVLNSLEVLVF